MIKMIPFRPPGFIPKWQIKPEFTDRLVSILNPQQIIDKKLTPEGLFEFKIDEDLWQIQLKTNLKDDHEITIFVDPYTPYMEHIEYLRQKWKKMSFRRIHGKIVITPGDISRLEQVVNDWLEEVCNG